MREFLWDSKKKQSTFIYVFSIMAEFVKNYSLAEEKKGLTSWTNMI